MRSQLLLLLLLLQIYEPCSIKQQEQERLSIHGSNNRTSRTLSELKNQDDSSEGQLRIRSAKRDVPGLDCRIEEHQGFLNYVCRTSDGKVRRIKCHNSKETYLPFSDTFKPQVIRGNLCSNDPYFYQGCGGLLKSVTNDKFLCGTYLCYWKAKPYYLFTKLGAEMSIDNLVCNGEMDCVNTDWDERGCAEEITTLLTGTKVQTKLLCDNKCDVYKCEDEAECNGYRYRIYCPDSRNASRIRYIPSGRICDGYPHCAGGEDERGCTPTKETQDTCVHYRTGKIVPIFNFTRCTVMMTGKNVGRYCYDMKLTQTNCTDPHRVGLVCEVNGYLSTVASQMICPDVPWEKQAQVCDDNLERICPDTSKSCRLHKHYMCDGKKDCVDGSDEKDMICDSMTVRKCKRRLKGEEERELTLPLSWLDDGVKDCLDGEDEGDDVHIYWPTCGKGGYSRFVIDNQICDNVYLCPQGEHRFVELKNLCDGVETCGKENKVCSAAKNSETLSTNVRTTDRSLRKHLSICIKGIKDTQNFNGSCIEYKSFIYPEHNFFGVDNRTSVILPKDKQVCDHMFGEQYVYTSCTNKCKNSPCPLRNIPRYEFCPKQYTNRIGTIVNNEYLAFFTRSYGDSYTNRYFVCDNKEVCLDYTKVCDLIDDCGDGSDEDNCTNHFKCKTTEQYIPKTKKCDKIFDCSDLSDECNDECSKTILEDTTLKGLSWLIGSLAILANFTIICKSVTTLKRCNTSVALLNKFLVMLISVGDLMVGSYLFLISIYDGVIFKENYCSKQIEWITSINCSAIGVLSTVGSQVSLFAMCLLSLTRLHGIYNSMRIPGEVSPVKVLKIVACLTIIIAMATAIAAVPIISIYEDFFVNGLHFSEELKVFVGTPNKQLMMAVLESYYGRMKDASLRWNMIIKMVGVMYSHDASYPDHTTDISNVEFYGNDGVCLFKYFVKEDDPQRNFVWTILALNFVCFVLITISYINIGILSYKSSKHLTHSGGNQQISRRNQKMNRRISIIITTDFLCWVPFIVICALHSLEILDATPWYALFSIVILPINSVINPLIYDDTVTKIICIPVQRLMRYINRAELLQRVRDRSTEQTEIELSNMSSTRRQGDQ